VQKATGVRPQLPERLADLFERPERCTVLPNDLAALQRHIEELVMETA
jgi:threonine synthase